MFGHSKTMTQWHTGVTQLNEWSSDIHCHCFPFALLILKKIKQYPCQSYIHLLIGWLVKWSLAIINKSSYKNEFTSLLLFPNCVSCTLFVSMCNKLISCTYAHTHTHTHSPLPCNGLLNINQHTLYAFCLPCSDTFSLPTWPLPTPQVSHQTMLADMPINSCRGFVCLSAGRMEGNPLHL